MREPHSRRALRGVALVRGLVADARAWPWVVASSVVVGVAVVVARNPYEPGGGVASCQFLAMTGWWCPGCGGTRAVYSMAHGDVSAAWDMNPLVVAAVPVLAALWWRWWRWTRGYPSRPWGVKPWHGVVLALTLALFFVLRNVPPFAPFLAP